MTNMQDDSARPALARGLLCAVLASVLALTSACSIGPQNREAPATYDLGPPRAVASNPVRIEATLLLPDIAAPAWLDTNGIAYRLSYENAARTHVYANSRWTAPPAALLTQRVRASFAAVSGGVTQGRDGARSDYLLKVELDDFSQSFESPAASQVNVRARATLVNLGDRTLRAQRSFAVERAAAPDAPGAAAALAQAGDAFIAELVAWAAHELKAR